MAVNNAINLKLSGIVVYDGAGLFSADTTTNHNVLVGSTSNGITNVAPSATSGVPLVSNGSSSDPSFTTAVVAGGGTGNTTFTAYALIAAGTSATAAFQNVVGLGSSGTILRSAGAAALPAWSTATYPNTASGTGTLLRADGTNWVASTSTYPDTNAVSTILYASSANVMSALATANDGVLVTSHTGVPSILAGPGAAGKVLQSNAAAAPSYSTPTYPSASGTTRKILVSDGTNNVYSTETWAVPGTSGNFLVSDGTNWVSTNLGILTFVTKTLTNAQIKALHATPVQLVAAPGAGKAVIIVTASVAGKMIYGGTNIFTAGAAQTISIYYGTTQAITVALTNASIVAAQTNFTLSAVPTAISNVINTTIENVAVNLYNPIATEITGNAAANNTMDFSCYYYIVTL